MAFIKAISYYLPEKVVTNEELVKEFPEWSVDKVAQKVGVESRHVAAVDENTILLMPCATILSSNTSVPHRLLL